MDIFFVMFVGFLNLLVFTSLLILIRNRWVFDNRQKIMRHEHEVMMQKIQNGEHRAVKEFLDRGDFLANYLSYNQMMFRFWVWDIEKLRKY